MLKREQTEKALNQFLKYTIQQARTNLTKGRINQTKNLYNSLDYDLKVTDKSFSATIQMPDYGWYQDQGVSGKEKKYNTPFKYTNKMPPPNVFLKFITREGIVARGRDGRFSDRLGLAFAMARSVFYKGIRPTRFLSKPLEKGIVRLPQDIIEAFGIDVETFLNQTLKNSNTTGKKPARA